MTYLVGLTMKSRNVKTGPIPVSTTSEKTCPNVCPLQANGCYAEGGHVGMQWRKVTEGRVGGNWDAFLERVRDIPEGALWRHNQAGDLPGDRETIDAGALAQLFAAQHGRRGFTYTHYDVTRPENAAPVRAANDAGFTVNVSANNLAHADTLAETGAGPVVVVLPETVQGRQVLRTPAGRKVVVCPATYRDDVTCKSCGLCALQREAIVGFPAHGVSKRKASAIAAA